MLAEIVCMRELNRVEYTMDWTGVVCKSITTRILSFFLSESNKLRYENIESLIKRTNDRTNKK